MADLSKLAFLSSENYMKRKKQELRYRDVTLAPFATGGFSINHGVQGVPDYDVQADLARDNSIWTGSIPEVGGGFSNVFPELRHWITDTTLTVNIQSNTNGTITIRVWYLIYEDYA